MSSRISGETLAATMADFTFAAINNYYTHDQEIGRKACVPVGVGNGYMQ